MTFSTKIFGLALITAASFSTAAFATEASRFELNAANTAQTVSYDGTRTVHICVDKSTVRHAVKIESGASINIVAPGDCYTFKSSEYRVSTKGIDRDTTIVGHVASAE